MHGGSEAERLVCRPAAQLYTMRITWVSSYALYSQRRLLTTWQLAATNSVAGGRALPACSMGGAPSPCAGVAGRCWIALRVRPLMCVPSPAGESWTGQDEAAAEAELAALEEQLGEVERLEMPVAPAVGWGHMGGGESRAACWGDGCHCAGGVGAWRLGGGRAVCEEV